MKEIFKIFVLLVMICTFTACAAGGKTSDTKDISIKLESFSDVKKDILSTDTEYENLYRLKHFKPWQMICRKRLNSLT